MSAAPAVLHKRKDTKNKCLHMCTYRHVDVFAVLKSWAGLKHIRHASAIHAPRRGVGAFVANRLHAAAGSANLMLLPSSKSFKLGLHSAA